MNISQTCLLFSDNNNNNNKKENSTDLKYVCKYIGEGNAESKVGHSFNGTLNPQGFRQQFRVKVMSLCILFQRPFPSFFWATDS
jgi:hypothetical protein